MSESTQEQKYSTVPDMFTVISALGIFSIARMAIVKSLTSNMQNLMSSHIFQMTSLSMKLLMVSKQYASIHLPLIYK